MERARAVVQWVGENVLYDPLFCETDNEKDPAEAAFVRGVADKRGYTEVFKLFEK